MPAGLAGPVGVSVVSGLASNTTVCFSAQPIYSTDLVASCPSGALLTFYNTTVATEVRFARKSFSAFSSTKRLSSRFASAVADASVQYVALQPSVNYYVYFSALAQVNTTLVLDVQGSVCPAGQIGTPCQAPAALDVETPATQDVPASSSIYFAVDPSLYNSTVGSVTFSVSVQAPAAPAAAAAKVLATTDSSLTLSAQVGSLPTSTSQASIIGGGSSITVENPGSLPNTLYIGVANAATTTTTAVLLATPKVCADNQAGASCQTIGFLSGALNSPTVTGSKSSDASALTVYQIDYTSIPATAQVVRASVSSKTQTIADTVYARLGAPPTLTAYDYRVGGGYVNQLVLPNYNPPNPAAATYNVTAWYIGIQASQDYSVWAGNNCANSCNAWNTTSTNGMCMCNGQTCDAITTYEVPTAADSYGVCQCKDTKKQNNYDCSALVESSSPFKTVYIVLIAVGGAIVLAVAIGVPVYCYLQNRKRDYERL
jgi:hypothetical protein